MTHRSADQRLRSAMTPLVEFLEGRQLLAARLTPFPMSTPSVPENTVLFANFDNGGEGVSFHDADKRNQGGDYRRTNIGVDIVRNGDAPASGLGGAPGIQRSVGHTRAGEWLAYTIKVADDDRYDFQLRYAASGGGTAHLEIDGRRIDQTVDLASTGGWNTWTTIEHVGINLTAGTHVLKFFIDSSVSGGDVANLNWFGFKRSDTSDNVEHSTLRWPDRWSRVNDAPAPRYEALTTTLDGKLYIFGGFRNAKFQVARDYSVYDANTDSWTRLGTLPGGMAETHAQPATDGRYIYFVGGFAGDLGKYENGASQRASNRVHRFDPQTNEWKLLTLTPSPQGGGGTAIIGRDLHFFGGNSADRVTNVGDHYVLNLDDVDAGWRRAAAMPDAKDHFSTVTLDGKIYTIGGEHGHDKLHDVQKTVHVYDPARDAWRRLADLPIANGHAEGSTFVHDGQILFAGGQTDPQESASDRVFVYDVNTDRWSEQTPLPFFLQGATVTSIGTKVIVTQGSRYAVDPMSSTFVGTI